MEFSCLLIKISQKNIKIQVLIDDQYLIFLLTLEDYRKVNIR